MAIVDRAELTIGTKLVAKYYGTVYHAEVQDAGDGNATIVITDDGELKDTQYASVSGAGRAIRGGKATNGWAFWSIEAGTEPTSSDGRHDEPEAESDESNVTSMESRTPNGSTDDKPVRAPRAPRVRTTSRNVEDSDDDSEAGDDTEIERRFAMLAEA